MMHSPSTEAACAAYRAATAEAPDVRTAVMALLAAARACDLPLADEMPAAAVKQLVNLIDAASALLLAHGGPLDLAFAAGTA